MTEEKNTAVVSAEQAVADVATYDPGLGAYNFENLGEIVKFSKLMSQAGEMLPEHLRMKPPLCMAVTMRAIHWGFDPFALAMETYQAKQGGPIGYQAKVFTAALKNSAGITLEYRYEGDVKILDKPVQSARGNQIAARTATGNRKCIAFAEIDGKLLEYETPELDGITIKNSPQWHNDPDQQLAYFAGRGWARRYMPSVMMGAYSSDEVKEMKPMRDVTPKEGRFTSKAMAARASDEPVEPEEGVDVPEDVDVADETQEASGEALDGEIVPEEPDVNSLEFAEGRMIGKSGDPITRCPYQSGARAVDWMAGWKAGRDEGEE
jgi:ribosome modulation factor